MKSTSSFRAAASPTSSEVFHTHVAVVSSRDGREDAGSASGGSGDGSRDTASREIEMRLWPGIAASKIRDASRE